MGGWGVSGLLLGESPLWSLPGRAGIGSVWGGCGCGDGCRCGGWGGDGGGRGGGGALPL